MNHYFASLAFDSAKLAINSFLLDSKVKYFPTVPDVEQQCFLVRATTSILILRAKNFLFHFFYEEKNFCSGKPIFFICFVNFSKT